MEGASEDKGELARLVSYFSTLFQNQINMETQIRRALYFSRKTKWHRNKSEKCPLLQIQMLTRVLTVTAIVRWRYRYR